MRAKDKLPLSDSIVVRLEYCYGPVATPFRSSLSVEPVID